ncbi:MULTISPECIES: helix-turn-helix domain-containing protein [Cupriavidus]|uniref:HTH cro/C1-type domain-containing protein n=1 Tax=Cupriavidus pinatubonensis (strain JMP 134 / LMG 1197) TaxID=264198 RepID=Q471D9_CUPPJ|nr:MULTISPECIES: helix-turn-helix transcriptional regulator [Cupriavidus]
MSLLSQTQTLRNRRGITIADLSRMIGMAAQNLSTILRGKKDSRASTFESLAAAMDAEWVLVPKEKLAEVRQVLDGKGSGPDRTARSTLDYLVSK